MSDDQLRVYKLKTMILSLIGSIIGVALLVLSKYVSPDSFWSSIPIAELGSTIFITSTLVVVWDYLDGRDRERRDDERVRRILKESAPDFRDAVVQGFAVNADDLARVATPELLDGIAKNVLALRLGDRQFAEEIYTDVRDQAIRAAERWTNVDVSVRLSSIDERSAKGAPLFDLLIEWEYTTVPSHAVRKFTCVSDTNEFYDLVSEVPATSAWFMPPHTGVDAAARSSYELVAFAVDGEELPIRRSTRKTGQTYTVHMADDVIASGKPVRIRTVYRALGSRTAHRLFLQDPGSCPRPVTVHRLHRDRHLAYVGNGRRDKPGQTTDQPDPRASTWQGDQGRPSRVGAAKIRLHCGLGTQLRRATRNVSSFQSCVIRPSRTGGNAVPPLMSSSSPSAAPGATATYR